MPRGHSCAAWSQGAPLTHCSKYGQFCEIVKHCFRPLPDAFASTLGLVVILVQPKAFWKWWMGGIDAVGRFQLKYFVGIHALVLPLMDPWYRAMYIRWNGVWALIAFMLCLEKSVEATAKKGLQDASATPLNPSVGMYRFSGTVFGSLGSLLALFLVPFSCPTWHSHATVDNPSLSTPSLHQLHHLDLCACRASAEACLWYPSTSGVALDC